MLLTGKVAVIYGGGGSIGAAIAAEFAREGARVWLAGRTRATLASVAESIRAASLIESTELGRAATLIDVGAVAAFVASDKARTITDTWVNIGAGAMPE